MGPPTRSEGPPPSGVAEDEIELGYVSGVFGVRGEVRLFLYNPESTLLDDPRLVVLVAPDGTRRSARMVARSGAGKRILGRIDGVDERDAAEAIQGFVVAIAKRDLPAPDPGEFYVVDLVGLPCVIEGEALGRVADVHATDGGDILEIEHGDEPIFVPIVGGLVDVDLDAGVVRIDPSALDDDAV